MLGSNISDEEFTSSDTTSEEWFQQSFTKFNSDSLTSLFKLIQEILDKTAQFAQREEKPSTSELNCLGNLVDFLYEQHKQKGIECLNAFCSDNPLFLKIRELLSKNQGVICAHAMNIIYLYSDDPCFNSLPLIENNYMAFQSYALKIALAPEQEQKYYDRIQDTLGFKGIERFKYFCWCRAKQSETDNLSELFEYTSISYSDSNAEISCEDNGAPTSPKVSPRVEYTPRICSSGISIVLNCDVIPIDFPRRHVLIDLSSTEDSTEGSSEETDGISLDTKFQNTLTFSPKPANLAKLSNGHGVRQRRGSCASLPKLNLEHIPIREQPHPPRQPLGESIEFSSSESSPVRKSNGPRG